MDIKLLLIGITLVTLVVFLIWELKKPARSYTKKEKRRAYATNSLVFIFNNVITYLLSIVLVYQAASTFSFYNVFNFMPVWLSFMLGILLLDLCIWFWHMINHKVPLLWRFHQTHHSERYLNTTSAARFHIGELLLSVAYKSMIIILFGIPLVVFLFYEALITIFAIYHHANIALPQSIRSILEPVIITPHLHKVHHSNKQKEHDSNYGVIFSWWDKIFRTQKKLTPETIGLTYGGEKDIISFLTMPLAFPRK